jgi:thiamine-monophosphate kinase
MSTASLHASTTVADLGELALVERITAALPRPGWVVVGPGDDAAVVEVVPRTLEVLTTDAVVDGVHVDSSFTPPGAIGHRALAVNLSDLAAMGARPRSALLSLILPAAFEVAALDQLLDGMVRLATRAGITIVGGNVTSSPAMLVVDVTATGHVPRRRILQRAGARVGDHVYVTGTLGDAALGLRLLQGSRTAELQRLPALSSAESTSAERRYLFPEPRTRAGVALSDYKAATSCIDLSDGLADGVRRIAEASGVGITIDVDTLPLGPAVAAMRRDDPRAALELALGGGDDYELLFTVSPRARGRLRGVQRTVGDLPITRIGTVTRAKDVRLRTADGDAPLPRGFAHFA